MNFMQKTSLAWCNLGASSYYSGNYEIGCSINSEDIKQFRIFVPPLDEQKTIVSRIEALEKEIHELEAERAIAEKHKKHILQKYL